MSPASPLIGNTVYTYDKRGNILSAERYALKPRPLESVLYSYTGDILSSCTTDQQTVSFSHDALGRMTSDGLAGTTIAYNHLDKPRIISKNHVNSGNYSYLADGTLVDVEDGLGLGLVYRGSLIYRKDSSGTLTLESAGFDGGRITPGGVRYHVTDHLGSVVMVIDGATGTPLESGTYGEYGQRSHLAGTQGRYHFSGKEDQGPEFGIPYTDFGARHLSTTLRRWLVQDPLSEKYYGISPYTYCDGDPVNMVDPNGESIRVSPEYQQAFMDALTAVFDKYADCFSFDEDGYLTYSQGDKKQLSREASSVLKGLLTVISQQTVTNVYFTTNITLPSGINIDARKYSGHSGTALASKNTSIDENYIMIDPNATSFRTYDVTSAYYEATEIEPGIGYFIQKDYSTNSTDLLFHELGHVIYEHDTMDKVIDYNNHVRKLLKLKKRKYDQTHNARPNPLFP